MSLLSKLLRKKEGELKKNEPQKLSPEEVFKMIKDQRKKLEEHDLKNYVKNLLVLADRMKRTGQTEGLRRLNFLAKTSVKEAELIKRGYDDFVWKRKLDEVLDPADASVKICELEEFTRVLPEEAVKIVEDTNDLFSAYFVMFTDYTGREDRKRATIERNKDPILFGAFVEEDKSHNIDFGERMYPLYSWKDEYCELTLDELAAQYKEETGEDLVEKLTLKDMAETVEKRLAEFNIVKDENVSE